MIARKADHAPLQQEWMPTKPSLSQTMLKTSPVQISLWDEKDLILGPFLGGTVLPAFLRIRGIARSSKPCRNCLSPITGKNNNPAQ